MSTAELRREIKQLVDKLPADRLESLADYAQSLNRAKLDKRLKAAEKAHSAGKGTNWRMVRKESLSRPL